jgi:hypothetical protein
MSTDWHGDLGYGFPLTDSKLLEDINEGKLQLPNHLDMMWAGDAFSEMETFIIVKDSKISAVSWCSCSQMISPEKLIAPEEWETELMTWADEHNIVNAAIGWWLCTSLG